ncbi:unnamed protein product [Miscanthus lutarioriparius]|uniref:PGG domain-containing protein n=1 Tax=Miscanthus lutarioriparius TaxID=422564 RepID=A0A811QI83_9POAL|nr:unnamed protein product [Miscanthus lutarioriparius]
MGLIKFAQHRGRRAPHVEGSIYKHGQCSIHEVTAGRNTVLHVAAAQGHHELIRELCLRFRDHQGLLSRRNLALDTPLHSAARAGHATAVKMLAQLARDCGESILGCKNEAGDTALLLAARHGHGAAVEALVMEAAELAAELNNAGVSAMYLAVISGSLEAVRAITTCRAASSAGPSSQNALHAAVFHSTEMVELLLKWSPELVDQVDSSGSTPLHFASSNGDLTIVRAILSTAPPTRTMYKKDSGGQSALHVAARMGHAGIVVEMVRRCPDAIELRDDDGRTFVHTAAREKRSNVVALATTTAFQRGHLDTQDRDGNTPLHLAVAAGAHSVVKDLLRKGKVRTNVLNNDGHTAFDLAAGSTNFFTMVSLVVTLVAYGAQLRPQRQDHLKPWRWSGGNDAATAAGWQGIDKTSDSLALIAVLIASSAFAAGFNLPGGYNGTTGEAILARKVFFKWFLCLDTVAVATSVVAVVLLVYGKASRSAGSWKSFVLALHCMWVSLVSLLLAFFAALTAVVSAREAFFYVLLAIYTAIHFLTMFIVKWIGPHTGVRTVWRFLRQYKRLKAPHVIKRQYPLAGAIVLNLIVFWVTSLSAYVVILFIRAKSDSEQVRLATSPAPSPL